MIQEHGGNTYGYKVLDFSANINPLGLMPEIKESVISSAANWETYPDPKCMLLRKKLSEKEGIPIENIVCGNGADDLIYRIVYAFKPKKAVITAPAFSEYKKALGEINCITKEFFLNENENFNLNENFLDELKSGVDMVFICNPNNPTGQFVSPELTGKIAEKCRKNNITLICDECFIEFAENWKTYSFRNFLNENVIILSAFTKLYAMAGLRLGYAICGSIRTAEKISRTGQFWSVSSVAQSAGISALENPEYLKRSVEYIKAENKFLSAELSKLNIKIFPSETNYMLIKSIKGLDDILLKEGILIRNCNNYSGLGDGFYRIAVRTHEENSQLILALKRCLNG